MTKKLLIILMGISCFLAGGAFAEDIDIYGQTVGGVKPNCLIIFDTSGSMTRVDVPVNPYDYTVIYDQDPTEPFNPDKWYYRGWITTGTHTECNDVCVEEVYVCDRYRRNGTCRSGHMECIRTENVCETIEDRVIGWMKAEI